MHLGLAVRTPGNLFHSHAYINHTKFQEKTCLCSKFNDFVCTALSVKILVEPCAIRIKATVQTAGAGRLSRVLHVVWLANPGPAMRYEAEIDDHRLVPERYL